MANKGSFVKGVKKPNQGKRGPDKINIDIKRMILGALDKAGGEDYLLQQAKDKPAIFLQLVGKVLPMQVTGKDGDDLKVTIRWER